MLIISSLVCCPEFEIRILESEMEWKSNFMHLHVDHKMQYCEKINNLQR